MNQRDIEMEQIEYELRVVQKAIRYLEDRLEFEKTRRKKLGQRLKDLWK